MSTASGTQAEAVTPAPMTASQIAAAGITYPPIDELLTHDQLQVRAVDLRGQAGPADQRLLRPAGRGPARVRRAAGRAAAQGEAAVDRAARDQRRPARAHRRRVTDLCAGSGTVTASTSASGPSARGSCSGSAAASPPTSPARCCVGCARPAPMSPSCPTAVRAEFRRRRHLGGAVRPPGGHRRVHRRSRRSPTSPPVSTPTWWWSRPATADLLARAAAGRADDLLTATLLVTRAPVLMAPAMHTEMWTHPATVGQRGDPARPRRHRARSGRRPADRRRLRRRPAARARAHRRPGRCCCCAGPTRCPATWPVGASWSPPAVPGSRSTRSATWATGRPAAGLRACAGRRRPRRRGDPGRRRMSRWPSRPASPSSRCTDARDLQLAMTELTRRRRTRW